MNALLDFDKPLIEAVHGAAIGGGYHDVHYRMQSKVASSIGDMLTVSRHAVMSAGSQ